VFVWCTSLRSMLPQREIGDHLPCIASSVRREEGREGGRTCRDISSLEFLTHMSDSPLPPSLYPLPPGGRYSSRSSRLPRASHTPPQSRLSLTPPPPPPPPSPPRRPASHSPLPRPPPPSLPPSPPPRWMMFFQKLKTPSGLFIFDTSEVSPLAVLLLGAGLPEKHGRLIPISSLGNFRPFLPPFLRHCL